MNDEHFKSRAEAERVIVESSSSVCGQPEILYYVGLVNLSVSGSTLRLC